MQIRISLAVTGLLAIAAAAHAGGSIALDEVIEQLSDDEKLTAEILAELRTQNLKAEDVICTGARFGGHWRELGGARSVPYDCEIGTRTLHIEGTVHIYDDAGNELSMDNESAPETAVEYGQRELTWTWK